MSFISSNNVCGFFMVLVLVNRNNPQSESMVLLDLHQKDYKYNSTMFDMFSQGFITPPTPLICRNSISEGRVPFIVISAVFSSKMNNFDFNFISVTIHSKQLQVIYKCPSCGNF